MAKILKTEEYAGMPIYFGKDSNWVWAYAGKQNEFDGKFEYRAEASTKEVAFKKIKSQIDSRRDKIVLVRKNSKKELNTLHESTSRENLSAADLKKIVREIELETTRILGDEVKVDITTFPFSTEVEIRVFFSSFHMRITGQTIDYKEKKYDYVVRQFMSHIRENKSKLQDEIKRIKGFKNYKK